MKLHQDYRGYRLYLIGEDGFAKDDAGRFIVHVMIGKVGANELHVVRIPNCTAWTCEEAEKLSREHGKRLIEEGAFPMPERRGLAAELLLFSALGPCWKPDRFGAEETD